MVDNLVSSIEKKKKELKFLGWNELFNFFFEIFKLKKKMKKSNSRRKKESIEIKQSSKNYRAKNVHIKTVGFDDLPKQLQKYILGFLASNEYFMNLSLVSRSW